MVRGLCADVELNIIGIGVETETMAADDFTDRECIYYEKKGTEHRALRRICKLLTGRTPGRKSNPEPSCCEATVLPTAPPCCPSTVTDKTNTVPLLFLLFVF